MYCQTSDTLQTFKGADVVFDRYFEQSTKNGTRINRVRKLKPICRVIDNCETPDYWVKYLGLPGNKANLAKFVCEDLQKIEITDNKELVVGDGFEDTGIKLTVSSTGRDVSSRIVSHAHEAYNQGFEKSIIQCHDADVLVMLFALISQLIGQVWMKTGTSKQP